MSYQEKKTIVSMITGILVLTAYCIYAIGKYQSGYNEAGDLKFWAGAMLIFVGIGVVAAIVIQIVFHILLSIAIAVQEKLRNGSCDDKDIKKTLNNEMVEDEMDKLIKLKSMRVGFIFAGTGFIAALVALVLEYSPVLMLNIIFVSFTAGSMFEGFAQIYYYRRGVKNG